MPKIGEKMPPEVLRPIWPYGVSWCLDLWPQNNI